MIILNYTIGFIFGFIAGAVFFKKKREESHPKCPPAYEKLPANIEAKYYFKFTEIKILNSAALVLVKQLKKNTWDKDLADKIIENLTKVERIIK